MSNKTVLTLTIAIILAALAWTVEAIPLEAGGSPAQPGSTIPYAGRLTDAAGQPVADGSYDFLFSLYDAETGGTMLWSEKQPGLAVKQGTFSLSLGNRSSIPPAVHNSTHLWLAVAVKGLGDQSYTTLNPRQLLNRQAPTAAAAPAAGSACPHTHWGEMWGGSGVGLIARSVDYAGLAGIGTTSLVINPMPLGVYGVYGEGDDAGVVGQSSSGNGVSGSAASADKSGVYGFNSGSGYGMTGSSQSGKGVLGVNKSTGNYAELGTLQYGIHSVAWSGDAIFAQSPSGNGVNAQTSAANKSGVYGRCAGSGCYGVYSDGNMRVTGSLVVDGQATGFFPRPAYDSGWVAIAQGQCLQRGHNMGGNEDDYVVDLQLRGVNGIHNAGFGMFNDHEDKVRGGYYTQLNNQQIQICRAQYDLWVDYMRVRIWRYK